MTHRMVPEQQAAGDFSSRRASGRQPVGSLTTMRHANAGLCEVEVVDFSPEGCRIVSKAPIAIGSEIVIGLSGAGSATCRVVWNRDDDYGCSFAEPLGEADMARAFTGSTVVHIQPPEDFSATALDEPEDVVKYAPRTRALIFLGAVVFGWTTVIGAAMAVRAII